MPVFDLICLANSKKQNERCIAGLKVGTGEWIRPISAKEHGELTYSQRNLGEYGDPRILDVIRVGLSKAVPTANQPENWLIDRSAWKLIHRPAPIGIHEIVRGAIYSGGQLFGSPSECISMDSFSSQPARESLVLVKPEKIRWMTSAFYSRRKSRVLFKIADTEYNLPVTDPAFDAKLQVLEVGCHESKEIGISSESRILFTVSLGEPFNGRCYKLVATVFSMPDEWLDEG